MDSKNYKKEFNLYSDYRTQSRIMRYYRVLKYKDYSFTKIVSLLNIKICKEQTLWMQIQYVPLKSIFIINY